MARSASVGDIERRAAICSVVLPGHAAATPASRKMFDVKVAYIALKLAPSVWLLTYAQRNAFQSRESKVLVLTASDEDVKAKAMIMSLQYSSVCMDLS